MTVAGVAGMTKRPSERRQFPRIKIIGELAGLNVGFNARVHLIDISPGGFSIASTVDLPLNREHAFEFMTDRGPAQVRAKPLHSLRVTGDPPLYCLGCAFLLETQSDRLSANALINEASPMCV
jgi:hypothetical protein